MSKRVVTNTNVFEPRKMIHQRNIPKRQVTLDFYALAFKLQGIGIFLANANPRIAFVENELWGIGSIVADLGFELEKLIQNHEKNEIRSAMTPKNDSSSRKADK